MDDRGRVKTEEIGKGNFQKSEVSGQEGRDGEAVKG